MLAGITWWSSNTASPSLLNHGGWQVLTEPDGGPGRQDRDHDGPQEGGEEGDHGEGGEAVHPVLQTVGLAWLAGVVRRGGWEVTWRSDTAPLQYTGPRVNVADVSSLMP